MVPSWSQSVAALNLIGHRGSEPSLQLVTATGNISAFSSLPYDVGIGAGAAAVVGSY
jgi:hypothetical protein